MICARHQRVRQPRHIPVATTDLARAEEELSSDVAAMEVQGVGSIGARIREEGGLLTLLSSLPNRLAAKVVMALFCRRRGARSRLGSRVVVEALGEGEYVKMSRRGCLRWSCPGGWQLEAAGRGGHWVQWSGTQGAARWGRGPLLRQGRPPVLGLWSCPPCGAKPRRQAQAPAPAEGDIDNG